ncbi:hypothetical protein GSI_10015 [Ganoderma sinense ZZ0214-1]|uniref:Uncharacterized protein n=1 Tax=Ganoderma sinense ZZ0214-1 TaxID=1077348 RepID=A0A2G8S288_9APHY|nr:hypothetical protein GSI_10015 [Ganoderma sinense ZZ0214-1]
MVFQQVLPPHTAISFPAIESDGYRPILRSLKVITQVCRLWRDVAFGAPELWTRIDARHYPGDELLSLVQRSSPLPLSLFLDNVYEDTVQTSSGLLRNSSSRLDRVDITMKHTTPSVIEELLSFDGSTLRCFTMSSPPFRGQSPFHRDSVTHAIPILQGHADTLEAPSISPSIGWIPTNHFPNLTHLYIAFDILVESPSPHDVLSLLLNTPCLEILHIHRLDDRESRLTTEPSQSEAPPVELARLRSLVFTVSAYPPAAEILQGLSLQPSALIRLDNLFIPYNSLDPDPIPAELGPLSTVTELEFAVEQEMLFLVAQGTAESSGGFWLKPSARTRTTRSSRPSSDLGDFVHLSELSVRLVGSQFGTGTDDSDAPPPLVHSLCVALSCSPPQHQAVWPRNMSKAEDLGVPAIIAMLSTRARFGHPIRRLVVQAVAIEFGLIRMPHLSEQLVALAAHVEEYEDSECVDADVHACPFEMRDVWNFVRGAEEYWAVDDKLRARYGPLWGSDYATAPP